MTPNHTAYVYGTGCHQGCQGTCYMSLTSGATAWGGGRRNAPIAVQDGRRFCLSRERDDSPQDVGDIGKASRQRRRMKKLGAAKGLGAAKAAA